jgi:phenylalanyl-tRNA synthetase beta chain
MHVDFPSKIVGIVYLESEVVATLHAIGCTVTRDDHTLTVTPPTWRPDLTTAEDLVEEVARIDGYDRIPSILPTPPGGAGLTHAQRVRRLVADVLAGQGLSEVWSAPFVGTDRYAALGLDVDAEVARTVRLANPLSDEQPLMRTRLLATMVDALRRNVARGNRDIGLFELGLVVALDGPQGSAPTEDVGIRPSDETLAAIRAAVPPQPRHLGLLLAGDRVRAGWWGAGRPAEVADVVELARTVGEALGLALEVSADAVAPFHPGRCARVTLAEGTLVGHVGELHPKVVAALGLPARTVGGELDLDVLTTASEATVQAHTLHTYPMAQSDVAVVVDEQVPADAVQRALRDGAGEHLEALTLFDVYRGDQVGEGSKSLAYRLTFRAPDRTLTTDEVSALRDTALRSAAEAVGAVQRA